MSDNGWPGEPGVPLNPERDGWHWVKRIGQKQAHTERWIGSHWWLGPSFGGAKTNIEKYEYLGPVLTPAEVDARIATARKDALREAAQIASNRAAAWAEDAIGKFLETKWDYESRAEAGEEIASAILARAALGEKE